MNESNVADTKAVNGVGAISAAPDRPWTPFNVNNQVEFELTNEGVLIWQKYHHANFGKAAPPPPTRMSLWAFMEIFGQHFPIGCYVLLARGELRFKHELETFGLALSELRHVNRQRAERWHPGGLEDWSVNDWLTAFGGEAGEALNAGKKHRRILGGLQQHGDVPMSERDAAEKIMEELADTVIYADLCASRLGMSLAEAIVFKFNAISEREGFPERLSGR